MLYRLIRTIYPVGLAALLAGTLAAVPAAASTAGLHVVASPFISNSSLGGAAVIAPGDMWAVGAIGTGPFQPLAEHFNGTGWSVVPTPALSGALGRVAGAAGNDVWAVGDQAQGSSVNTLIEHWDGTRWSVSISKPSGIAAGPDGALWFTNYGNGSIGRITTAGKVTTYTDPSISLPYGIAAGPDGALWFTELFTSYQSSIGRITTAGKVTNYTDPSISRPAWIAAGPDGALWFTKYGNGSIGRITTAGAVTNYTDPSINLPYGIAAGPDGALWFTEFIDIGSGHMNSIGRITTQ